MRSEPLASATSTRNKRFLTAALIVVLAVVFGFAAMVFVNRIRWIRNYGQAEPLVMTIWPMANEMKRFNEERGRSPGSLDEIDSFSSHYDLSMLRRYTHVFTPTGPRRIFSPGEPRVRVCHQRSVHTFVGVA